MIDLAALRKLHEELIEDDRTPSPDWLDKLSVYEDALDRWRRAEYVTMNDAHHKVVAPYVKKAMKSPSRIQQLIAASHEQQKTEHKHRSHMTMEGG